eukprot:11202335-Lingulodinium_polyedra.AAC.1
MDSPRMTCCGQDKNPPRVSTIHFAGTGPSPLMIEMPDGNPSAIPTKLGRSVGIPGTLPRAAVHQVRWHSLR